MDFQFSSKEELYKRVLPALNAKVGELHRMGFKNISQDDIWNYLIQNIWIKKSNLVLSDIVSDILHVDNNKLNSYLNGN